jgi:hypothetical protein
MNLSILSSCTGEKAFTHKMQLTICDFQAGPSKLKQKETEFSTLLTPAENLYTGEQHKRLMRGIEELRRNSNVNLAFHIISAGYGLITSDRNILPYEATFTGMNKKQLVQWANTLNIPKDFRKTITAPYDFGMILLGEKYLEACQVDGVVSFGGPTLLFCSPAVGKKLPIFDNVKVVTLYNPEARRMSCGLTSLKGELAARILRKIMKEGRMFVKEIMTATNPLDLLEVPKQINVI